MAADPTGRPAARFPCTYWDGTECTATSRFPADEISCYNAGNCDGFGTCRGCNKYTQGGLKIDDVDGQGGYSQTPLNLQVYNVRAKIQPCCNWRGALVEFSKDFVASQFFINPVAAVRDHDAGSILIQSSLEQIEPFPNKGTIFATRAGKDENGNAYPEVKASYESKDSALGTLLITSEVPANFLNVNYVLYLAERKAVPVMKPASATIDAFKKEKKTFCVIPEAAPWQEGLTEENPSAYGCNGAKAECPFYTGPKFAEVIDAKMDMGNRVTARQVLELRYYSQDWSAVSKDAGKSPRELWEESFVDPDIWAWARDRAVDSTTSPGKGRMDPVTGKPLLEKVSVRDFLDLIPDIDIGSPIVPPDGTPVVGGPPTFPTLVKPVLDIEAGIKIVFPQNTSIESPFIKRSFTPAERFMFIAINVQTDRPLYAINLTKHPQGHNEADDDFIQRIKKSNYDDVYQSFGSGLPGYTFQVELEYSDLIETLNKVRVFVDSGLGTEDVEAPDPEAGSFAESSGNVTVALPNGKRKYSTADFYIGHIFHHAHVAQRFGHDKYGHKMIDPWVNHFTDISISGQILSLRPDTHIDNVLWNTITSEGKKTMYSIETVETLEGIGPDNDDVSWKHLSCGYILVEFLSTKINRTAPWKAWDKSSLGQELYVKLDRSGNTELIDGEPTEVEYEMVLSSTKGTVLPANMAVFKVKGEVGIRNPDVDRDKLSIKYAYTEYKQGPIVEEDKVKLKFPSDINKVTDAFPYSVEFGVAGFEIEGTFLRAGDSRIRSCEEVIGDCYTEKARKNEELARTVFFGGGVDEQDIQQHGQIVNTCAEEFNSTSRGNFEDGTPVTYTSVISRLTKLYLKEGTQQYLFIFKDEEGRPIGVKNQSFLLQSAIAQTRDVEIRYKWGNQAQHYQTQHPMFMFARSYAPIHATTYRLVHLIRDYDPYCGDHAATEGGTQFRAFNLEIDEHGPLWYPFKRCLQPKYHADSEVFTNVVEYEDVVEGFDGNKRRSYWERMRAWDKYMPAIMDFIPQPGCFWSERTTTINTNPPYVFLGYTKIRSGHPFGYYASDRESLRLSRHWEKRNLAFDNEVISQDAEGGLTVSLDPDYEDALYDEGGNLRTDATSETPIWVHINDGLSVVKVASEESTHPFNNLILTRVGNHNFSETYSDERHDLRDVTDERDYTSTAVRSEDGTKVYLADHTELNAADGLLFNQEGKDVKWVYKTVDQAGVDGPGSVISWCWMATPEDPEWLGGVAVGGIRLSNPTSVLFKSNRVPATFTTEDLHQISYTPYTFDSEGAVDEEATISMDGGPAYKIDPNTGQIYYEDDSPYNPAMHQASDEYKFVTFGPNANGAGILADNRGKQRFELEGAKFFTYAGLGIHLQADIDELPYSILDAADQVQMSRLSDKFKPLRDLWKDHGSSTPVLSTPVMSFLGHYYVEALRFFFYYGSDYDIPTITAEGQIFGEDSVTKLFSPTEYITGLNVAQGTFKEIILPVRARLSTLRISFGARVAGKKFWLDHVAVDIRHPKAFASKIQTFSPKVNVSTAEAGSTKPSDLEFYFQRSYPDFAKSYLQGQLSIGDLVAGQGIAPIAGVEVKFNGRRIKDVIPTFELSDPIFNRFPYGNIDMTKIAGYTVEQHELGTFKFIAGPLQVCSKGWTMATNAHSSDPGSSLTGPSAFDGIRPMEELQETIYNEAATLLGDKKAVYESFWHPKEKEFFAKAGVDLDAYSWTLSLSSTVASIDKVLRHEDYGCSPEATNEYVDGLVHKLENWQARGVFHYTCDPKFNHGCGTVLMNKCESYLFREYGTTRYLDNDVLARFTYVFTIPPNDYTSYLAAGLIDKNYTSGVWGGFNPTSPAAAAVSSPPPVYTAGYYTEGYHRNTSGGPSENQ